MATAESGGAGYSRVVALGALCMCAGDASTHQGTCWNLCGWGETAGFSLWIFLSSFEYFSTICSVTFCQKSELAQETRPAFQVRRSTQWGYTQGSIPHEGLPCACCWPPRLSKLVSGSCTGHVLLARGCETRGEEVSEGIWGWVTYQGLGICNASGCSQCCCKKQSISLSSQGCLITVLTAVCPPPCPTPLG